MLNYFGVSMELSILFSGIVFVILLFFYNKVNRKNIPGPLGVPLLGFLPFLRKDAFRQFQELSEHYGKMFKIQIGRTDVLVLNDWTTINEALNNQRQIFAGRPHVYILKAVLDDKDLAFQTSTSEWKLKKKFAKTILKKIVARKAVHNFSVEKEVEKLIAHIGQRSGEVVPVENLFFFPSMNLIWQICSSRVFESYESDDFKRICEYLRNQSKSLKSAHLVNVLPIFRFFSRSYKQFIRSDNEFKEFLKREITNKMAHLDEGNQLYDYSGEYLKEILRDIGQDNNTLFNEQQLLRDLYVLFSAGTVTTAYTLTFATMYLATYATIQAKVHLEIDQSIGRSKLVLYNDRLKLPYTEATLLEILRCTSVVPFSHHMTTSATTFFGYKIPANMNVLPNFWALNHDQDLWGDPHIFRPERFLDTEGQVTKPKYFIPFSCGARRCLGEDLAKMELFVLFTSIMQHFHFKCQDGHQPPSLEPIPGIAMQPEPCSLLIERR